MPDAILYERLGPGHSRVETHLDLEQSGNAAGGAVALCDVDVGNFGKAQARLVVYGRDTALSIGFKTSDGALKSALPIRSGDIVKLAVDWSALLRRFNESISEVDIDAEFKRYVGDNTDPPACPIRVRVRLVSNMPPEVAVDGVQSVTVEADTVDEIDAPVLLGRVRVGNAPRRAPYLGPAVNLAARVADELAQDTAPLARALLLRWAGGGPAGVTENWIGAGTLAPVPLPLQDGGAMVLEYALPASVLRTWLRAETPGVPAPTIELRLVSVSTGAGSEVASRSVLLPVRLQGAPGDVLLLKIGNESVRTVLRPYGPVPTRRLATRLRTAPRDAAAGTESGLEALVFEATVVSNEPHWTLEAEATLTDHDSNRSGVKLLAPDVLSGRDPRSVEVPLPDLAAELSAGGCRLEHATLEVRFRLRRGHLLDQAPTAPSAPSVDARELHVELSVAVDRELPPWLACIDFGASSIAVGVASGRTVDGARDRIGPLAVLPLGEWFKMVDPFHSEVASTRDVPTPSRGARDGAAGPSVLLPSHVGLSSALNLRSRFDPMSYGDLEAMLDDSVFRRLELLGREYDISMPYPSGERLLDEFGKVVFALKRDLAKGSETLRTMSAVDSLRAGVPEIVTEVNVARLFANCFHELGGFLVPRVLHHATRQGARGPLDVLRAFRTEAETGTNDGVGVVVTHPFGLDAKQLTVYREAGRCFLAGLTGCAPNDPDLGKVVPVPEALAAARYGLFRLLGTPEQVGSLQRIICLDIGAGTYDVTIIDAETRRARPGQPLANWTVHGHFGLLLGGTDLDNAIARRVIEIVEAAADTPAIDRLFAVERNLKPAVSQIDAGDNRVLRRKQRNFLEAVQRAKKHLAEHLLGGHGTYQWGTERLLVDIGTSALPGSNGDDKPLACRLPNQFPQTGEAPVSVRIAEPPAELQYGRDANGTAFVTLSVGREAFESRSSKAWSLSPRVDDADVGDLTEVLARRIPELAAASASAIPGRAPDEPVWWIVTGRAALWPTIYAGIADVARKSKGRILAKPFPPEEMKKAVLEGALRLAVETHLPLTTATPPMIGIVTRGDEEPVVQPLNSLRPLNLPTGTPRELVRMLPGLDLVGEAEQLCMAFESAGLQPWTVLVPDIDRPDHERIEIAWISTQKGVMVAVTPDGAPDRVVLHGPFREDRIYGQPEH